MKNVLYVLLIGAVCAGGILLFGGCNGALAKNDIDEATIEAVDALEVDNLPTIDFETGELAGVTVLGAGDTANLLHQYAVEDDAEDAYTLDTIVQLNKQYTDANVKVVRNMSWPPAVMTLAGAVMVIAILLYATLGKGNK